VRFASISTGMKTRNHRGSSRIGLYVGFAASLVLGACSGGGESDSGGRDAVLWGAGSPGPRSEAAQSNPGSALKHPERDRPDESISLEVLTLHDTCEQTQHQQCRECRVEEKLNEDDCWSLCEQVAYSNGPVGDCLSTCARSVDQCVSECDEDAPPEACVARSYVFTLGEGTPNAALQRACEAAVKRGETCAQLFAGHACDVYAQVERDIATDVYDCIAQTECGEDPSPCTELLEASQFSKTVSSWCGDYLAPALVRNLDMLGRWMNDDVLKDLRACERACGGEFSECVEAWVETVMGGA
jgi:hypothetical protein